MSISLFIYSPDPPLEREAIIAACRNKQLSNDLQWELAFLDHDGTVGPDTGTLRSQRILGWRPGANETADMRTLLATDNRAAIDDLYSNHEIAAVMLEVATRDQDEWPIDDELVEQTLPQFRDDVANAHTWYDLETDAHRNRLSFKLQEQLWRIIGVLSNGLMEDPQDGQYTTRDGEITSDRPPQIRSKRRPLPG